jgi:hypothetical protein
VNWNVSYETKLRNAQAMKPAWNKDFLALIFI